MRTGTTQSAGVLAVAPHAGRASDGAAGAIDRLTDEDARILRLGRGLIRGHTCKVVLLERSADGAFPSVEAIGEHIAARLDAAPRFRKRVVETPLQLANPVWLDDPAFDIARHVSRIPTDGPLSFRELERLVADLMTQRLDRAHPLWHLAVVEQLEQDRMALIWRVHHSLADGTTLVRRGEALLWDETHVARASPNGAWLPSAAPGSLSLLTDGLADRWRRWRMRPPTLRWTPISVTGKVVARELRPGASRTRLDASATAERSVAFAAAPLEESRRAGKAIDESITLNDVILGIIAGAIRAWLGPNQSIRVKVPVSLHQAGEGALSNHNSFLFVDLPLAEADPARRLVAINRETSLRKLSHDAETLYRLGAHPLFAHYAMTPRVFTFSVSNVRGPAKDVYVLGARVAELYSVAEIAQHHALRMAVISSGSSLFFGLCADRQAVSDLPVLAAALRRSTEELLARAR